MDDPKRMNKIKKILKKSIYESGSDIPVAGMAGMTPNATTKQYAEKKGQGKLGEIEKKQYENALKPKPGAPARKRKAR